MHEQHHQCCAVVDFRQGSLPSELTASHGGCHKRQHLGSCRAYECGQDLAWSLGLNNILYTVAVSGFEVFVAVEQSGLINPVIDHSREAATYEVHSDAIVAMDRPNISSNLDATEALGLTMNISSSNCYVADVHRESMSPQQFTATYDQARDFIREAGKPSAQ